jgi:hypothetical protein
MISIRMRIRSATVAVTLLVLLAGRRVQAQTASYCLPADQTSGRLIAELHTVMKTTVPWRVAQYDTLYRIPRVPVADVAPVTDARTCQEAAEAVGPRPGSTALPRLHVVRLGNKGFAVLDPMNTLGSSKETVLTFDGRWRRFGGVTGP